MKRKFWASLAVGGLLVGAGFLASVVSSPEAAFAQEDTDSPDRDAPFPHVSAFIDEVLDGLVASGTITRDQADAVVAAAEDKASELKEEREAARDLLEGLLDDGMITKEESEQLPDDHFLFSDKFDGAWEDGVLTARELRGTRHPRGRDFRQGFRLGSLLDDGGIDQEEYDSLAAVHPLKQADVSEYLEDGLITRSDLREIFSGLAANRPDTGA